MAIYIFSIYNAIVLSARSLLWSIPVSNEAENYATQTDNPIYDSFAIPLIPELDFSIC